MTYSPIQLDIIRTFGSKELSEGCLFHPNSDDFEEIYKYINEDHHYRISDNSFVWISEREFDCHGWSTGEILGHRPELFPDVARVAKENNMNIEVMLHRYSKTGHILSINKGTEYHRIEYNPTLPLIDQDEQLTLIPLLSLIK